jgi:hypothetical protein
MNKFGANATVLWDLKLHGDINETHQGGNAKEFQKQRLADLGMAVTDSAYNQAIVKLRNQGLIKTVKQGLTVHAIRLGKVPNWPPNPFENAKPKKQRRSMVALELEEPAVDLNGHGELSITQRLQLIEELCVSVREDMEQYKSGVMAGL